MAKSADFGLSDLMVSKGRARGGEPQDAVEINPTPEDALEAVRLAAAAKTAQEGGAGGLPVEGRLTVQQPDQTPLARQSGLPFAMRPSSAVPQRNVQVRLPEPLADALKAMAFYERTSQQEIMERAITDRIREWQTNYERDRAGD